jgi:hypothetical protein
MMTASQPYGTWRSAILAKAVAGKSLRFGALQAQGVFLYWSESRPDEGGRGVIMRMGPEGAAEDVLPRPFSARSKVHEYGGGEYLVAGEDFFLSMRTARTFTSLRPAMRHAG